MDSYLGEFVRKTLEETIEFRRELAENRKKFLAGKEKELQESIEQLLNEITTLDQQRQRLLSLLNEAGALDSIHNMYNQLIEQRVQHEKSAGKLNSLAEIEQQIAELRTRFTQLAGKVIEDVQKSQAFIDRLRLLYREILAKAIFVDESSSGGYFDIRESPNSKVPVAITVKVPQSDSLGKFRLGLLGYSLTIFLNLVHSKSKMPHFLIHDGVFHSIARKTVVNILNFIYGETRVYPAFQYIFTANEEEIMVSESETLLYGQYIFDIREAVIATYEATPGKMIFKREY